ncbi:MAG: hypothetical protein ACRDS0_39765, partial [Pseudonocardiaceae bacterium]
MTLTDPVTPLLVLVHRAWHGPWCWAPLQAALSELLWQSVAVELPSADPCRQSPAGMHAAATEDLLGGLVSRVRHPWRAPLHPLLAIERSTHVWIHT